jgi:hypothetical protein
VRAKDHVLVFGDTAGGQLHVRAPDVALGPGQRHRVGEAPGAERARAADEREALAVLDAVLEVELDARGAALGRRRGAQRARGRARRGGGRRGGGGGRRRGGPRRRAGVAAGLGEAPLRAPLEEEAQRLGAGLEPLRGVVRGRGGGGGRRLRGRRGGGRLRCRLLARATGLGCGVGGGWGV